MGTPQTTDAKSPVATCSQRQQKVQLLPIRYAIVEQDLFKRPHAQTSAEAITDLAILTNTASTPPLKNNEAKPYPISLPHQLTYDLKSRPVGLRLVRDGYLYIYEKTGLFYEYKLKDGLPEQLLWAHTKLPDADKRTVDQKQDLKLLFNRTSTIYVCYSEIQWTMAKCKQIMGSPTECDHKMQKVNLSAVDCQQGGVHLLTKAQYEAFQSELNNDKLLITNKLNQLKTDQTVTEQSPLLKSYVWEENHNPAKGKESAQKLQNLVDNEYKDDHLYLVIRDDIGMLRDLAEYQDAIINLRKDWKNDNQTQYKFIIGNYIESLYTLAPESIYTLSKELKEYKDFEKEITPEQNQKVLKYIEIHNEKDYREFLPPPAKTFSVGSSWPVGYSDWSRRKDLAHQDMKTSLGKEKYEKYKDLIDAIDQQTGDILNGKGIGSQGVQDRIDRPKMEEFLTKQRRYIEYTNTLISKINEDRRLLFNQKAFFISAWYYCAQSKEQTLLHGRTHYEVYKDLGLTEEALTDIGNLYEKEPMIEFPILYTLPTPEAYDYSGKILSMIKTARDIIFVGKDMKDLAKQSEQLQNLITAKAPYALELRGEFGKVAGDIGTIYNPALQKQLAHTILELKASVNAKLTNIDDVLRTHYSSGKIAKILRSYRGSGLTLKFASLDEIKAFKADLEEITQLREARKTHSKNIQKFTRLAARAIQEDPNKKNYFTKEHKANYAKQASAEQAAFNAKELQLAQAENRVVNAFSVAPRGEVGGGRIGVYLDGLTPAQIHEIHAMEKDFHSIGKTSAKALRSSLLDIGGGDFWSVVLAVKEICGLYSVAIELFSKKEKWTTSDFLSLGKVTASAFSACFGAAQGISATILFANQEGLASTAGKLTAGMRYGALMEVFGLVGYFSGTISAYFNITDRYNNLVNARENDNVLGYTGAVVALVGASGQGAVNTMGTVRSAKVIIQALLEYGPRGFTTAMLAQAGTGIKYFARFTLYSLFFTALEFIGEWLYNRFNLTRLDKWLEKCVWVKDQANRGYTSLKDEDRALNHITTTPIVTANCLDQQVGKKYQRIKITLPSINTADLDSLPVSIGAGAIFNRSMKAEKPNYTDDFIHQLQIISKADEPLTFAFDVSDDMTLDAQKPSSFYFTIEYPFLISPELALTHINYTAEIFMQGRESQGSVRILEDYQFGDRNGKVKPTLKRVLTNDVLIGDVLEKPQTSPKTSAKA